MPKYQVHYEYTVKLTHCVNVEADSYGDAHQMADEMLESYQEEVVTVDKNDWEFSYSLKYEDDD